MSVSSAKPAPSLKELWANLRPHMAEPKWTSTTYQEIAQFEEALREASAPPAAERTTLKDLRDSIEAMRQEARRDLRNPPDDGVSKNFDIAFFGGKSLGLLRARQEVDKLLSEASQR